MKRADRLLLACLLVVAALVRVPSLLVPHDRGDQVIWASVARNISEKGSAGYTLRGIDPSVAPLEGGAAIMSFVCVGTKGAVLESFVAGGEKYWDSPLVNQPPGFFGVLLVSHGLFGTGGDGFPLLARDPLAEKTSQLLLVREEGEIFRRRYAAAEQLPAAERGAALRALDEERYAAQGRWERGLVARLVAHPAWSGIRAQLWATLPPLLADLVTVAIVFLAAFSLGGRWAALLAGALWACDPIAIFCASRVLSNTALTAACAAALLLEGIALERKEASVGWAILVGVVCAIAISIKVSAVFLLPALAIGRAARGRLDRDLAIAIAVALLASVPWWIVQWRVHGHPFGFAWRTQGDRFLVSPWGRFVTSQGPLYYAFTLLRSPAVAFGVVAAFLVGRKHATAVAFSLLILAAAFSFEEKEARHLLLAYPPLVVFAAVSIAKRAEQGPAVPWIVGVVFLLLWQASHGVSLALDVVTTP